MNRSMRHKLAVLTATSVIVVNGASYAAPDSATMIDVIASSFGIELPHIALNQTQTSLSASFREQFQTRASLRPQSIQKYFRENPSELLAFRDYSQTLHNSGYLSHSESVALVRSAFLGFSENSKFEIGRSAGVVSDSQPDKISNPLITTSKSPSEIALHQSVKESALASDNTKPPQMYVFGEDIQKDQDEAAEREAARLIAQLEAEQKRKKIEAQAAFLMQQLATTRRPKQTLLERVNSILNQHTEQVVKKKADEIFDNAEISITSTDQGPEFNARVLKAFDPNPDDGIFNYGELGLVDIDDRQTLNIGFGIRALDPSERIMYGANFFFDQEFPYNHQRASVGVELATSPFRLNANRYYALSGGRSPSSDLTEQALSGQDLKAKIAFPYLPNLFFDYSKFKWFGQDGLADIKGQTVGISGALSDSFSIEFARKIYSDNDYGSQNSASLTYNYIPGSEKSASLFTPMAVPYALERLDAREKYAMTNRENEIQKQQTSPGLQVRFSSL